MENLRFFYFLQIIIFGHACKTRTYSHDWMSGCFSEECKFSDSVCDLKFSLNNYSYYTPALWLYQFLRFNNIDCMFEFGRDGILELLVIVQCTMYTFSLVLPAQLDIWPAVGHFTSWTFYGWDILQAVGHFTSWTFYQLSWHFNSCSWTFYQLNSCVLSALFYQL